MQHLSVRLENLEEKVYEFSGEDYTERYGTLIAPAGASLEAVQEAYQRVAQWIMICGFEPIMEKIYGCSAHREDILRIRQRVLSEAGCSVGPVTFIDGKPPGGGHFGGLQWWGVSCPGSEPCSVAMGSRGQAILWKNKAFELLYIPALMGGLGEDRLTQTREMFLHARDILTQHGFTYAHVVRTWIYMRNILTWYDDFNAVRNALYAQDDFIADAPPPASTGIEGSSGIEYCLMDVLAFKPAAKNSMEKKTLDRSAGQGLATDYGSAFSRGMSVRTSARRTIYVSGPAAIDDKGQTESVANATAQTRQTVGHLKDLLKEHGSGLENICSGVLYCRSPQAYAEATAELECLGLAGLPFVRVLADVCRPDLEVEIEAIVC